MKTFKRFFHRNLILLLASFAVSLAVQSSVVYGQEPDEVIEPPTSGQEPSEPAVQQPSPPPSFQLGRDTTAPSQPPSYAVKPDRYTVLIADETLERRGTMGDRMAETRQALAIYANGQRCTTASLTDPSSNRIPGGKAIEIGAGNQPAACRENGARIQFVDSRGYELATEFVLELGRADHLSGLVPKPPATGSGLAAPSITNSPTTAEWILRGFLGALAGGTITWILLRAPTMVKRVGGRTI